MFRKQQIIVLILLLIGAAVAVYQVTRPGYGQIRFEVQGQTAYVNGGTNSKSYGVVKAFLDDNPQVNHLVLERMPGTKDADTNLHIARLLRKRGLSTHVTKDSYIVSGTVDLFLAGVERTMDCGGLIGVHSWSYTGRNGIGVFSPKNIGYDQRRKLQEHFLKEMGIDPAFYEFTRDAADADEIYILEEDDLRQYDILTHGTCAQ